MGRYILRRLLHAVVLVSITLILTFAVLHLAPGDPANRYVDPSIDPADVAHIRSQFGLDEPVHVQFVRWLGRFVRGDFGTSLVHRRPVADILRETIPRTLLLTSLALLVQIALGVALGILAAARHGRRWDTASGVATLVLYALPTFYLAYLLISLFSLHLGWLPIGGVSSVEIEFASASSALADRIAHLVLPVTVLAAAGAAGWARFARGAVLDELAGEHIRTARAKGLGARRVLLVHALRGALPQLLTLVGVSVPYLIGGAVVVEKVFAWPGMGALVVDSIFARDYPVVIAANFLAAVLVIVSNLLVDVLYGIVDPRMEIASTAGRAPAR